MKFSSLLIASALFFAASEATSPNMAVGDNDSTQLQDRGEYGRGEYHNKGKGGNNSHYSGKYGYRPGNNCRPRWGKHFYNNGKSGARNPYGGHGSSKYFDKVLVNIEIDYKGKIWSDKGSCSPDFLGYLKYRPSFTFGNIFQFCYDNSATFKSNWNNDLSCRSSWDNDSSYRQNTLTDVLSSVDVEISSD
ncbi:hypothetical protein BB560_005667 [Smittium megazygosporum]|uniref:Uncharacterized protein n=1 Tax=Smittium megazygosporum TaxID=133381 RepID=A0A2T9Z1J4_9FUNG|nr:hypothetical protein BB560_005667 [Smittium megazygosporum]